MNRVSMANQIDGKCLFRRRANTRNSGFTLVEIIIVALLLGVLLSGVWSMFQMQNRMMMQGQRISRENTEIRGLWSRFRTDIQTLQLPTSSRTAPSRRPVNSNEIFPESTLSSLAEPSFDFGSQADEVTPVRFTLEGGKDWLVFDRQRPWQQWPGLPPTGSEGATSTASLMSPSTGLGSLASNSSLSSTVVTPYQRVMYIWLTSEEIEQYLGTSVQAPLPDDPSIDSPNGESGAAANRWLFRLSRDWGQSFETQQAVYDDQDNSTDSMSDPSSSGIVEDGAKLEWLEWFVATSPSPYVRFEQWQGNILEANSLNAELEEDNMPEESNASVFITSETQIDWMTTVTAGQFRYRIGEYWRSRLSSPSQNQQLLAIEVQYNVNPYHVPTPNEEDPATGSLLNTTTGSLDELSGFDDLEDPVDTSIDSPDSTITIPRPEYDFVCLAAVPRRPDNGPNVQVIRTEGPSPDRSVSENINAGSPSDNGGLEP